MDSIVVPVGLLCVSACSCVHLWLKEPGRQGRLRLPENDSALDTSSDAGDDNIQSHTANGNGSGYSAINGHDHDQSSDVDADIDPDAVSWLEEEGACEEGIPVDLEKWWYKVRLRKAALVILLALSDTAAGIALGWDAITRSKDVYRLVEDALMVVFWTILVTLSILSFPKRNIARHFRYTVYITVLTFTASMTIWARILVPTSSIGLPADVMYSMAAQKGEVVTFALSVIIASLSLFAFLIAGTIPHAPRYHFHSQYTYSVQSDLSDKHGPNVSENITASVISILLFGWVTPVINAGSSKVQMGLDDLPHLSASFRTVTLFRNFRRAVKSSVEQEHALQPSTSRTEPDGPRDGLGYAPRIFNRLLWRLLVVNRVTFGLNCLLALITACLYYLPAFFLNKLLKFLEVSNQVEGKDKAIGYAYCLGLLLSLLLDAIATGQLWYISNCMLASRIRTQMNSVLFAKTLRRKDITGVAGRGGDDDDSEAEGVAKKAQMQAKADASDDEDDDTAEPDANTFTSKSQVLNLFSVDCDRVADSAGWSFSLIDAPVELIIGTIFLYQLLGYAGIAGLGVTVLFLPINHYTSKSFATVQDKLMATRDRRVSLMNEVLSSIRYIKFMAYERPFEKRILKVREEELEQQRKNYFLEVAFNFIWGASPIACVLVSFFVYVKIMGKPLTPSIAFTSLAVFNELEYAINVHDHAPGMPNSDIRSLQVLPDTFISALQCFVSLRRIERYLGLPDVENAGSGDQLISLKETTRFRDTKPPVSFVNATVTWPAPPQEDNESGDSPRTGTRTPAPGSRTPARRFMLPDITVDFPIGELSLVCGPLGSGKTLLLLGLLGEADLLSGQIVCPRSPINTLSVATDMQKIAEEEWILPVCAYVPQSAWLLNASIQDNILFGLPIDYARYSATLEACSLLSDLEILEDGDQTEIGEKGVNLSGGQKARVSLARAVYSRASYLFLDDILSAVDAHTAAHLFEKCLRGPLLRGRTVVLVSHHVQLCAPAAQLIVHLDNGMVAFSGTSHDYMQTTLYSKEQAEEDDKPEAAVKLTNKNLARLAEKKKEPSSSASSMSEFDTSGSSEDEDDIAKPVAPPRKLVEDEARAVGKVAGSVWLYYLRANGQILFWTLFVSIFVAAKGSEIAETYWLRIWSNSYDVENGEDKSTAEVNYYLGIYAILTIATIIIDTLQWLILYIGGLRASKRMYEVILRSTLRAPLRFFDTMALGRLLNRFGKDFEQIDAQLPDHLGKTLMYVLGVVATLVTVSSVSPIFVLAFALLCVAYSYYARLYSTTAREMRRLDSVTKSPVFSLYGEAIAGVAVIRAFGASARFMLLQIQRVDKNIAFYYYLWAANRWLSVRFALLSALLVGLTGVVLLALSSTISASIAGFALSFALHISNDMLFLVRRYTALELAMVGVERVKEYSEIQQEPPEIVEPRPPASWPHAGEVIVDNLCIRYAPELPRVLHGVSFKIQPGEKVGIVGATGSGKSTMALSFFRFVEADEGSIHIDGLDIANVGLYDLRSRLTIIPQDPTILSGSLRSTLDPLEEYEDVDIFDALKRARLLPIEPVQAADGEEVNYNPFYDLDTEVSEQGQNFSAGERQLLCLARALLKQHPLILMDEATSSVDYETDALITTTIAEEFKHSSLLVIAHRLRTVIGFDKILVLDAGRVAEFESPAKLIADPESRFHSLCKAAGRREFKILTRLAKRDYPPGAVLKRRKTKRSSSGRQDSK